MPKRILNYFLAAKPVRSFIDFTKRTTLPGFEKIPIYDVSVFFFKGVQHGDLTNRASSLAFHFFLAIFPSIIFLFTLIPYIPIANFQNMLFELLREFMPQAAFESTEETLHEIITRPNKGLLSFGFIAALYFSTNGFNAMINAFNSTYHTIKGRSIIMQRLISLLLVIIVTLLIVIAIGLIIVSEYAIHMIFREDSWAAWLVQIGKWVIIFALCFCAISFTYYLGPGGKSRWKFFSAGSTFAALFIIITSIGFAFYVNNFGTYNKLYGSIGTIIVIMLWIYFNSLVLLLGFDINASIHIAKRGKRLDFDLVD